MSTHAFKAALTREIEQAMKWLDTHPAIDVDGREYDQGQLDAYAHILSLVKDETLHDLSLDTTTQEGV